MGLRYQEGTAVSRGGVSPVGWGGQGGAQGRLQGEAVGGEQGTAAVGRAKGSDEAHQAHGSILRTQHRPGPHHTF